MRLGAATTRRSAIVLLSCLALCSTASVDARAAEPADTSQRESAAALVRVSLLVSDVDRSRTFYERLGFRLESEISGTRDPDRPAFPFPIDAPSTRWRLLVMSSGVPGGGRLGLLQYAAPAAPASHARSDRLRVGDTVLIVQVTDVDATCAALAPLGARVVEPPSEYRLEGAGRAGRPRAGRVAHVVDPDGHSIELLEAPARAADVAREP